MTDADNQARAETNKLLTEAETAARLRCHPSKVKRLRLAGKLAYYAGRPVLIDEKHIVAYLESIKCAAASHHGSNSTPTGSGMLTSTATPKGTLTTDQWVQKTLLKQQFGSRSGRSPAVPKLGPAAKRSRS